MTLRQPSPNRRSPSFRRSCCWFLSRLAYWPQSGSGPGAKRGRECANKPAANRPRRARDAVPSIDDARLSDVRLARRATSSSLRPLCCWPSSPLVRALLIRARRNTNWNTVMVWLALAIWRATAVCRNLRPARGAGLNPRNTGPSNMIRISLLAIGLVLSLIIPASGQQSQPSQNRSPNAEPKAVCRSECKSRYNQKKECQEEVAPMHSPCELFNQCLSDCD